MKRGIRTVRYRMKMKRSLDDNLEFVSFALRAKYRGLVANRLRGSSYYINPTVFKTEKVVEVAKKLKHSRLAALFVEAQFWFMPPDFCLEKFKKKYPPASVVFGGKCWQRYREYVDRGIRDGC